MKGYREFCMTLGLIYSQVTPSWYQVRVTVLILHIYHKCRIVDLLTILETQAVLRFIPRPFLLYPALPRNGLVNVNVKYIIFGNALKLKKN